MPKARRAPERTPESLARQRIDDEWARWSRPAAAARTTAGAISRYALACGGVDTFLSDSNVRVTLWEEHGHYHVRSHDHEIDRRIAWEVFDTLTPARQAYRRHVATAKRHVASTPEE